jgi:hypothetical protein
MHKPARAAVPARWVLPTLLVLASAGTFGLAAPRPAPATPLQVTYYYLPG